MTVVPTMIVSRRLGLASGRRAASGDGQAERRVQPPGPRPPRRGASSPGRARGPPRPGALGLRLRRPAVVLRALRREEPRARSRHRRRASARLRPAHRGRHGRRPAARSRSACGHCCWPAQRCSARGSWRRPPPAASPRPPRASPTAALGAGLVTALGFPYFARFVPDGEAGRYSGLFFAGRAVAAAAALPAGRPGRRAERQLHGRALAGRGRPGGAGAAGGGGAQSARARAAPSQRRSRRTPRLGRRRHSRLRLRARRRGRPGRAPARRRARARRRRRAARGRGARSTPSAATTGCGSSASARTAARAAPSPRAPSCCSAESRPPEAIVVLDSDGQHDPERIPAFVEAAREADVVIGDRRDRRAMPIDPARREPPGEPDAARRAPAPGSRTPRTGCASSARAVLRRRPAARGWLRRREPPPPRAARAPAARVASVEIPTIYDGEPSHFRPVRGHAPRRPRPRRTRRGPVAERGRRRGGSAADALAVLRAWMPRLGAVVLAAIALGLAMPLFQPLDNPSSSR